MELSQQPGRSRASREFAPDDLEKILASRRERRVIPLFEDAAPLQNDFQEDTFGWLDAPRPGTDDFTARGGVLDDPAGQFVYQEHNSFFRSRMPKSTHWSIVWSDLMMTMFIVFVVLFVFFSINPKFLRNQNIGSELGPAAGAGTLGHGGGGGLGEKAEPMQKALDKIFSVSRQAVLRENLKEFASVDVTPDKSVRIVLTGDLLFDSGNAELKRDAPAALAKIAAALRESPLMINVVGHTDDVPMRSSRYPSNWELSLARAGTVARFLIDTMGLPAERFYVTGHASYQPVRRNDSPENRAANRRVEIVVTKDMPDTIQPLEPDKLIRYAGQGYAL